MSEPKTPATPAAAEQEPRPAYEPPRLTRKKAVTRATLFTGGGGPTSGPPLVSNG